MCLCVSRSVCLWALRKRLNRSRCHLVSWVTWAQGNHVLDGRADLSRKRVNFGGYPSHWKALESLLRCTEMPLMADSCGPKEPFIRWGQVRTNPFASARGDRTAMRPFFKIIWPLVSVIDIWLVINKCGCITTQDKLLKLLVSFILHANMAVFRETV